MNKIKMKRKRRDLCTSPLLDDSPKRTKVHAQRKFAQGSNVNSPVITPIKELEIERPIDVLPEPVELLPIQRPNTEDFLTFLCFRGTPILPPSLNFFNTASIVDTNGQVHKIKSECPKNGPIDAPISKCGTSSEKPFIAFGVRKRADPIVISKQMDRKRRHALAIQALRRKYQEQKMAKIRALTISKLSEKVTNKTMVRTNSISRTETVTKKTNTIQKSQNIKVIATKHVKVTTRTLKTTLRPNLKQKMCLRSFRGRFVQKELPFRNKKKVLLEQMDSKKIEKKSMKKRQNGDDDYLTEEEVDETPVMVKKPVRKSQIVNRTVKKTIVSTPKTARKTGSRTTRSGHVLNNKINARIQQIKKRILLNAPNSIVKRRALRSTTMKKTVISQKRSRVLRTKQQMKTKSKEQKQVVITKEIIPPKKDMKNTSPVSKFETGKKNEVSKKEPEMKKDGRNSETKKDFKNVVKNDTKVRNDSKVETRKDSKIEKKSDSQIETRKDSKIEKRNDSQKDTKTEKRNDSKIVTKPNLKSPVPSKKEFPAKKAIKKEEGVDNKKETSKNVKNTEKKFVESTKKDIPAKKIQELKEEKLKKTTTPKDTNKKAQSKVAKKDEVLYLEISQKNEICPKGKSKSEKTPSESKETGKPAKQVEVKKEKDESTNFLDVKMDLPEQGEKLSEIKSEEPKPVLRETPHSPKNIQSTKQLVKDIPLKPPTKEIKQVKPKQMENEQKKEKKEDVTKKKSAKLEDIATQKSTRPTRKSKEAAAIYMEILSHKLVNDSKIDDDNVSIDSFPELPNVKKMEQRENELKAKAKTSKDEEIALEDSPKNKAIGIKKSKDNASKKKQEEVKVEEPIVKKELDNNVPSKNTEIKDEQRDKNIMISKMVEDEMHVLMGDLKRGLKTSKISTEKNVEGKNNPKRSLVKRKSGPELVQSDDEITKSKIRKTEEESEMIKAVDDEKPLSELKKTEELSLEEEKIAKTDVSSENLKVLDVEKTAVATKTEKRQTRHSLQNKCQSSDDSDESFHADIKIPRKKKLTRSKAPKTQVSPTIPTENTVKLVKMSPNKKDISSDSDQSTTSDVDLKTLKNRQKNKKFTKTKSMKRTEEAYSDSDEEPLSKLTQKSVDGSQSSTFTKLDKTNAKVDVKPKEIRKPPPKKVAVEKVIVNEEPKVKPKRECAKIPQNYLPMFSSSSDDEFFHGFSKKPEEACDKALPKILEKTCAHLAPSSDLLSKDISRRFGKGKVNMSNEQIEKWLKDSAMAGNSIKKENDEMLKFGEIIPTETTLEINDNIDTQKLKSSLLPDQSEIKIDAKISEATSSCVTTPEKNIKLEIASKIPLDRKLIFKKDKKDAAPNINAFSPENESSVYAFGEENEPIMSTPFRRPSRRPSSTATSKSEDESGKLEETIKSGTFRKPPVKQDFKSKEDLLESSQTESDDHFNIPQNPTKLNKSQKEISRLTKASEKTFSKNPRVLDRHLDLLDDGKYKVPSSPSASSSSSAKLYKKPASKAKVRSAEVCNPIHLADFPKNATPGQLVEAPVFHPSEQEFQDPIEYIERIKHKAEQFGICRIVPPSSFKPECKVQDDMRFTAYNQYVHKMLHRWGPNFKELMAIKKYLTTQNISLTQPPWIGGMEIDLPRLYQTVQTLGGLKEVIEKKRWPRVSELMKIPKSTQDRLTKLDDIYCKYLLPYDTLSPAEREKLFDEVETEWAKRESKGLLRAQRSLETNQNANDSGESETEDFEVEDCIVKGRTIALNAFYRIARNTMNMHFKNADPTAQEVEQEFWKHVTIRQNHICVHSGSIDSGSWGYGFAVSKNSPFARHAWNLKVFTNNSGSVLRSLGPLMGVTVPTLHVGMVFSACCWYRDPHGLPWIEYLHTGGNKIWYGIPNSNSEKFHMAVKKLMPNYCRNKALWLTSDTAMIPPSLLMENNVSLCRTVQEPGQFVVVFPKAFTSSVSTGYVVSESVYFAPPNWLKTARALFDELRKSCEPSMFSLDRLLLSIASDSRSSVEVLRQIIPYIKELCDIEKEARVKLDKFEIKDREKMPLPEAPNARRRKKLQGDEGDYECETCRMNLFVSMVFDTHGNATYCIDHALELLDSKKVDPLKCKFMFTYDDEEMVHMVEKINSHIEVKLQKKVPNKFAGMPTLLAK